MSEWWTYGLRDLLLFSPQTYYRQFELLNAEWWPLPLMTLLLGLALLPWLRGADKARLALTLLALCWLWTAWAFHWQRYAAINLAGGHFALAFATEALLLLWLALSRNPMLAEPVKRTRYYAGVSIFLYALLLQPLLGLTQGRSLAQAEIFGMAPDPTALATLGALLLVAGKRFWLLAPIPLLWCLVSGATLWAMGSPDFFVLPLTALLAVTAAATGTTAVQTRSRPHR